MKVNFKKANTNYTEFVNLRHGECFLWENVTYMKIRSFGQGYGVNLSTGDTVAFLSVELPIPLDGEINLWFKNNN